MAALKLTTICCKDWQQRLVLCINIFLQLLLFILFLIFFGKPSIEKYLEQKTIVVTTEQFTHGIEAPAISIVAKNNRSVPGWKSANDTLNFRSFSMFQHCQTLDSSMDMETCKMIDTINLDDFLKTARRSVFEDDSISLSNFTSLAQWTEDMTFTYIGRIFTLKLSTIMKPSPEDALVFEVNPNFEYYVWVHDENIFLVNQNHFGLPNQLWKITNGQLMTEGLYHEITLTKQKKLNLDDMPCEENPSYSLND